MTIQCLFTFLECSSYLEFIANINNTLKILMTLKVREIMEGIIKLANKAYSMGEFTPIYKEICSKILSSGYIFSGDEHKPWH